MSESVFGQPHDCSVVERKATSGSVCTVRFSVADARGGGEDEERSWSDFVDGLLDDQAVREHLLCGLTLGLKLGDLRTVATALGSSWDRLRPRPLAIRPLPTISATEVLVHLRDALADAGLWPDDDLGRHLDGRSGAWWWS